jgi:hypothetical protein
LEETATARNAPAMKTTTLCVVALALASLCAGCSNGDVAQRSAEKPARQFSEQERLAARALSIGQVNSVTHAASPYARAVLCKNGLDVIARRLRNASVLSVQQQQLMQQAQAYFDRQVHALAQQQGVSATDVGKDLRQAAEEHADDEENARIAVACVQGLQQAD